MVEKTEQVGLVKSKQDLTLESVQAQIKMPPELQEAYTRVVIAGMKVMFDRASHKLMLKQLQGEGPLAQRLGEGITGLMLMLFNESNKTIPPQVLIPAGIELLMQAVEFLRKSGLEEVTNKDIGDGMEVFVSMFMEKCGMSADKLVDTYDKGGIKAAAPAPAAPAPAPAPAQPPQPQMGA